MLTTGTALGPYTIRASLGAGGMGEVYRAHDTRLGRDVAVKVIHADVARDPGRIKRFEQEARAASALNHPNVCTIHDIGNHEGSPFVVMELLEGKSLGETLRSGPLPLRRAIDYAAQAARGLAAAHEKGILHRDLKPDNLFVTTDGRVKILDFGLAKLTRPDLMVPSSAPTVSVAATESGMLLGTVGYMSPEQVRGENADTRTDLFALGAVLYELLTGRRAFAGDTYVDTLHAILNDEPAPLTDAGRNIPPALESIVARCLEKPPERRFQSAGDLAIALESVSGSATSGARLPRALGRSWRHLAVLALVGVLAAVAMLVIRDCPPRPRPPSAHTRTEIAVLPFLNLSPSGPHAYFARGLHDELLTQLSRVGALKVVSRTSVMGYATTTKPLKQIAAELGVGSVVEGSVQVEGERLRVDVQLIDAATDKHIWADHYDRTLNDAFAIQSEVAQRVVEAVGAELTRDEQGRLAAAPTTNGEAYRLFMQGVDYYYRPGLLRQDRITAQRLLEQALAMDPKFALAHAALSAVHGQMYWLRFDPSPARAASQLAEAETALRLAPEEPQAHKAMALAQYFARRDFRRALQELTITLKGLPGDAETMAFLAWVNRRLGNWDESLRWSNQSVQLAPGNADLWANIGQTYELLRRYPQALHAYDLALAYSPGMNQAAIARAIVFVRWQGRLDTLRAVLGRLSGGPIGPDEDLTNGRVELLFWERDADGLLGLLRGPDAPDAIVSQEMLLPSTLYDAWAYRLRHDEVAARAAFETARARLDSAMSSLPDDWRLHAARGLALAGLGRRDEALREARWLEQSKVYREDAMDGTLVAEDRARILAQAGAPAAALDEIERLLTRPSRLTVHMLQLDMRWDPIREQPRFKTLLARYAIPALARGGSGS